MIFTVYLYSDKSNINERNPSIPQVLGSQARIEKSPDILVLRILLILGEPTTCQEMIFPMNE